ncbi:MAG: asparaginase [Planctomycetes bacterium]|nr:asparaginase [Planctomycetota bacterium]
MPDLPRIRLIFTGGTISMRDDAGRGAVPVLSGADLLKDVPGLERFCQPVVHDFGQLPGPHMTPQRMWELSELVARSFDQGFEGVVITHGTDTLEESAYLCDLRHQGPQPVVFVGAMRTSSQLSWDGPINLYQACRVAASAEARDRGVLVVMNSGVCAACEVTKTYTEALDTFQAPDTGPVAMFDGEELRFHRRPAGRKALVTPGLEKRVALIVASAGDDGSLIDLVAARGDKGVVIEALGRGNLPPPMAKAAIAAQESGMVVLLTSRCWGGRVSGTYGYEGGGARLMEAGLVFTPGIPGHKARILLMAALGAGMGRQEISQWLRS